MLMQLPLSQCLKITTSILLSLENTIFFTLHTEHSQTRWRSFVSHAYPGQERALTPSIPNLRPKNYSTPCHHHETPFSSGDTEVRLEQPASFSCLEKEEQSHVRKQYSSISHFFLQISFPNLSSATGLPQPLLDEQSRPLAAELCCSSRKHPSQLVHLHWLLSRT